MKSWTDRAVKIFAKEVQNLTVKTDETPDSGLSSVSSVQNQELIEDFLSQKINSSDQDGTKSYSELWCYPNSSAMNTDEITIFQRRVSRHKSCGLDAEKSAALAEKLFMRDREQGADDRISCLECRHLVNVNGWYCKNWQQSKVCIRERDAYIGTDWVMLLQRCDGFKAMD
jgi:hypothetical protein